MGRVGALAVALGVGLAVAAAPGVAVADSTASPSRSPGDSRTTTESASTGSSQRPSESDSDSGSEGVSAATSSGGDSSDDAEESGHDVADVEEPEFDTVDAEELEGDADDAQDLQQEADVEDGAGSATVSSQDDGAGSANDSPPADIHTRTEPAGAAEEDVTDVTDGTDGTETADLETAAADESGDPAEGAGAAPAVDDPVTTPAGAVSTADGVAVGTPLAAAAPPAALGEDATPIRSLVSTVLGAFGMAPAAVPGQPASPAGTPLLLAVLQTIRREIQETFFNRLPVVAYETSTTEVVDGVVTGSIVALDAEGDPLVYSVTRQPEYGLAVVDDAGNFTYTPFADAPQGVADSFELGVRDAGWHLHGGPIRGLLTALFNPGANTVRQTIDVTVPDVLEESDFVVAFTSFDEETGEIVGQFVRTDGLSTERSFSVESLGAFGQEVSIDDAGVFHYTPTDDARLQVAAPLGLGEDNPDDVDVVTFAISDGDDSIVIDVTVPIMSARDTALGAVDVEADPVAVIIDNDNTAIWVLANDGADSTLTAYDQNTYTQLSATPFAVGADSVAMALDPVSDLLWVVSRGDDQVWVIDPEQTLVTSAQLQADPGLTVDDDVPSPAVVAVVDVGSEPTGIAFASDGTRVYISNSGSDDVTVIDVADPDLTTSTIAVGLEPHGVALSPDDATLYVANYGDSTVSVIDVETLDVQNLESLPNPESVGVSDDGQYFYVATQGGGLASFNIYSVGADGYSSQLVGAAPGSIGVASDGSVYMTNSDANQITVYDPLNASYTIISVGTHPVNLAIDENNGIVYVANMDDGTLSAVSMTAQPFVKPDDAKDHKGFDWKNHTSNSVEFVGYYDPDTGTISPVDDYIRQGPRAGTVYQPGDEQHWSIWVKGHGENTHVYPVFRSTSEFPGAPASTWTVDFKYNPSNNTKYVGCTVDSGNGTCNHVSMKKGSSTLKVQDAEGTAILITPDNLDYQAVIINNLCASGADAKCTFTATELNTGVLYSPFTQIGTTVVNNTLSEFTWSTTQSYTYTESDSYSVTVGVAVGPRDIVNAQISFTYGYTVTESQSFSTSISPTIQPGNVGYVCASTPIARATGDFSITQDNTTYYVTDTQWDSPDASDDPFRAPDWVVHEAAEGSVTSCSDSGTATAAASSGGGGAASSAGPGAGTSAATAGGASSGSGASGGAKTKGAASGD